MLARVIQTPQCRQSRLRLRVLESQRTVTLEPSEWASIAGDLPRTGQIVELDSVGARAPARGDLEPGRSYLTDAKPAPRPRDLSQTHTGSRQPDRA